MQINLLQGNLCITINFTFALLCKYLHNKALVESQVSRIYHKVYARLRNRQFYSLQELNEAISQALLA
ncbi:MAG: hypothetical protein WC489_08740, partial [Patescibacteria group bacterium]